MVTPVLYLCVDCGGTKTAAAIADDRGAVVAHGYAGPSNWNDVGQVTFVKAVVAATTNALRVVLPDLDSGASLAGRFYAAWIGASGIDRPQDIVDLAPILSEILAIPEGPRLSITNDTHLLASPIGLFPEAESAVVVIAGTGSNVSAFRKGKGGVLEDSGRIGGWGWILGDEGSGFHVGKETLRWILSSCDRTSVPNEVGELPKKTSSRLQEVILSHFGIAAPYDLFSVVYAAEPASAKPQDSPQATPSYLELERKHRISSLAPLVFKAAFDDADEDALQVLRTTSSALVDHVRAVMGNSMRPQNSVLCFGGSLVGVASYRDLVVQGLREKGSEFLGAVFVENAPASGAKRLSMMFPPPE